MKKNILLFLMSFLLFVEAGIQAQVFITPDAEAQEWSVPDSCCYEKKFYIDETSFYAKILAGANFLQNSTTNGNKSTYQAGYLITGSLGYYCGFGFRVEGEYTFRRNGLERIHFYNDDSSKSGHFQTSSFMANLLWDLPLAMWGCSFWNIQPFIGAGIGYDYQQMHASNSRINFSQKWDQLSWQIMTGLTYPIYCNTELTLEYKFHQGGCHFYNQSVGVGIVYKFDFLELLNNF